MSTWSKNELRKIAETDVFISHPFARITKDVMEILHYGDESVSVALEEVKSRDWLEKVYKPDILNNWDNVKAGV